ncbi:MAG: energy-coupling factor transporter ATPase [Oscillospiraceae bacterium]|jgi:energy-coupling factor transport system ATP-binding protein|nr:energy-coupling factor transporter ATPase [Oscillospiraceae bacterium]
MDTMSGAEAKTPLIRFENVSYSYGDGPDAAPALDGVNLEIHAGEFIAVLGHNGCGKSTLAKLCNAVLTPSQGTVTVGGLSTADENSLLEIRRTVGMVFQNPDNQIVAAVVEEDVAFALENLGVKPEEIRERVDRALEAVNMSEYKLHAPHRLSGGQKQRISIAGILAMRPACIVLDEPTAMLDPRGRREVMETVHALNRETGMTVILITHHMNEAQAADRVLVMNRGKILLDDTPRRVFAEYDLLEKHALSVPQTVQLTHYAGLAPALDVRECAQTLYKWLMGEQPC